MKKEKLVKKYDNHVNMYEKHRCNPTLAQWRKQLIENNVQGKVLEVGVGVGANFPHYDQENVHITAVDFSSEMLKSAKQTAEHYQLNANFIQEDVEKLHFERDSFECIVSTLSLCSYPNPIDVLNHFNDWCKEGGTILLMEHGLSSNSFLSVTQKVIDPVFRRISGCHCDRDILKLIEMSNLQINKVEGYWLDIISLVWAKPNKVN
ncbi:class I SAM-dependent methyltransferase [Filobacillus milosensis]|uniref:Class I SAM-dependent methyltransferase n=1 Tax=Filobacillus milosensis TaxID=94137 RepID=A0A4Y8IEU4_9BACI|nr:class I SAM-dependent methyltransferase [Filobacillus milosensis]TFB13472.1 class I SAM-dependent methyltransferase [Filobacillus milosensis]